MELRDRVVVVTGAGSGIGAALARRFHRAGARLVAVADIDVKWARGVAEGIGGLAFGLDVADGNAVAVMVEEITAEHGPIDLFCANAGIAIGGGVEAGDEAWQRIWEVNVMSQVYAARAVLPQMIARGEGYLLLTASAAGLLTQLDAAPYSVTKHASVALAEWLAITHAGDGIRVSCLCPQFVNTPMAEAASITPGSAAWVQSVLIEPEEVAEVVLTGIAVEKFLILPHPEVEEYFQNKAGDYERWLGGMRKLRSSMSIGGEQS
jgi:NAD(P)-dependent dehydrogenase (short-subunit alcohol dehydrogenase family)